MSNEVSIAVSYNVIIDSIGTANPSVSTILSEVLGTPVEIIAKALYNSPSTLFTNVDEELAEKSIELLEKMGVVARYQTNDLPLPIAPENVDIGVYIHDLRKLPTVTANLSDFLGCTESETMNLLMADPSIVLGGVSKATGKALSERIDAEIIISEPKNDLYTLIFNDENKMIQSQIEAYLKYANIHYDFSEKREINDLNYTTANQIWSKFSSTGMLKIINQSFQRYEIILDSVDASNNDYRNLLTQEIGMPEEVIDQIIQHLPVQLEASVNQKAIYEKLSTYQQSGLNCSAVLIKHNSYKLIIEENENLEASKAILSQFIEPHALPKDKGRWESPVPVGDLIFRCISTQLEEIGCMVDYEYL